jgi:hypothetical protein
MSGLYRIVQADTHEPIELDGRWAYGIETVEAEIRKRPERFVLRHPEPFAPPLGLVVKRVRYDPAGDDPVYVLALDDNTRRRLELLCVQELARNVIEMWRAGSGQYDIEEFQDAVAALADALPPKAHPPIASRPDDPF